jgi:hypothetical protein
MYYKSVYISYDRSRLTGIAGLMPSVNAANEDATAEIGAETDLEVTAVEGMMVGALPASKKSAGKAEVEADEGVAVGLGLSLG